jgi:hypothetical protein
LAARLLGGAFSNAIGGNEAIGAEDPYVLPGVYDAKTVEWQLVGIDPELIDPDLVE